MKTSEVLHGQAGFNKIINGNFKHWQRGNTIVPPNGSYLADRWTTFYSAGAPWLQINRQADVPPSSNSQYCYEYKITTGGAVGATERISFRQIIEGVVVSSIIGKEVVFSFWIKASKIGKYCFLPYNANSGNSQTREFTVDQANTWERKHIRMTLAGNWNKDTSASLYCNFVLASGTSDRKADTGDVWDTLSGWGVDGHVNFGETTGDYVRVADVMLHEGKAPLEDYVYAGGAAINELMLCKRYYHRPGFDDTDSRFSFGLCHPKDGDSGQMRVEFPVEMRVKPSFNNSSPSLLGINYGNSDVNQAVLTTLGMFRAYRSHMELSFVSNGVLTADALNWFRRNGSTGWIDFDAEL